MPVEAYPVAFTQAARLELVEAQDWYESELAGLGGRFRQAIDAMVARISANPRLFPVVHKNVRRAVAHRFPYSLFFIIDGDTLLVIACFHASRNPATWQLRS